MKTDVLKKILLIIFFLLICADLCFAITLLTEQEALDRLLPHAYGTEITTQKITASQKQLDMIKKELGGRLVYEIRDRAAKELNQQKEFIFYFAKDQNGTIGIALILDEPGKWGPIKFIIYLGPKGEIHSTAVMKYSETRGRPVASGSFLRQFSGKTLNDPLNLDQDIQGISGATISSHAACFTMKKAMVLYKILVLDQK
ncbi:MAG: FMN-binding protein [Candidatus Omnitrophica bacterium]|nr:FMN-binding protein [Candidatus Omnitrophota bacterium]